MAGENNIIGLAMQLDVTDLKAGIKEVNQVIKSSKDEFNNATAGMDKWTKSSEGLNAKLKQLGTQLDGQQKIAAGYEAEIKRVSEMEGDHSAELEVLKGKLLNAQTAVKKTQSAMSHYQDTLSEVTKKEKEENSTLGKLQKTIADQKKKQSELTNEYKNAVLQYGKNSDEAKDLAKQLKTLSKEIDKNEDEVKDADKAYDDLGKTIDDVAGQALEKSVKTFGKIGAAVGGLVGSFLATAEGTRELRTNLGKVDTAFSEAGFSAEQAQDTYTKFYGILGDEGQATEAVSHLAKLSKSQEDLTKWTDIAAGVYGTFGDSLPIEGLTEAANETAKTGALTGGLADALNWAGISEDSFQKKLDACNTEQERQALIQDTLSKAYGGASAKYKETNADIIAGQEAQARLSQAMADVGAQAEPLMTSLKTIGAELLEKVAPAIEKLIPFIQNHLPELAIVLGTVTTAFGAMGAAVLAVKIKQAALTTATVAHTVATKAQEVAIKGATLAQKAFNVVLKANPIGIVITIVLALVAAFVTLWKKSDAFREFWIKLWDKIKSASKTAVDAIAKLFSACWDGIKKAWNGAGKFFSGIWKNIKDAFKDTTKWFSDLFKKAWDGIKSVFSKVKSFFSDVASDVAAGFKNIPDKLKTFFTTAWDKIKSAFDNVGKFFSGVAGDVVDGFKSLPDKMKSVGKNLVEGLWKGVNDMASWISGKLKGFSDNVLGGIKKFFGVHSPSTAMAEIGGYMSEGLAEGIEDGTDKVIKAGEKAGSGLGEGFNNAAGSSIKLDDTFDKLNSEIEKQKKELSKLEKEYKNAVMSFGETSTEAYEVAQKIITLTGELNSNEEQVKSLNTAYENLNATFAKQSETEINNLKLRNSEINKLLDELTEKQRKAMQGMNSKELQENAAAMEKLRNELNSNNEQITTLQKNLDLLNKQQVQNAGSAKDVAENVEEEKTAYDQLLETIKNQKSKLEELKKEYQNAILVYGEGSAEVNNFAEQIRSLTGELEKNQKQVDDLDKSVKDLTKKTEVKVEVNENKTGWQKFVNNCKAAIDKTETYFKSWSDKTGKYLAKISSAFDKVTSVAGEVANSFVDLYSEKLNKEMNAIDKDIEKLEKASEAEIEAIRSVSTESFKEIQEQADAAIDAAKETYGQLVDEAESAYETITSAATDSYNKAVEEAKDAYEEIKSASKEATDAADDKIKDAKNNYEKLVDAAEDSYKDVVDAAKKAADKEVKEAKDKYDDLVDAAKDAYDQIIAATKEQYETAVENAEEQSETEIEAAKERAERELQTLDKLYDKEEISSQDYRKRKQEIENGLTSYIENRNKQLTQELIKLNDERLAAEQAALEARNAAEAQAEAERLAIEQAAAATQQEAEQKALEAKALAEQEALEIKTKAEQEAAEAKQKAIEAEQAALEAKNNAEIEALKIKQQLEQEALDAKNAAELKALKDKTDAEEKYSAIKQKAIDDEKNALLAKEKAEADAIVDKEKKEHDLLVKKNELAKKQFEAERKNSIAQSVINGAAAILKGFVELGPVAGAANAIAQAAITAAQIATIEQQKYVPLLAKGGIANGATLAMIGEAGKEAVLPLENNTGWINDLAQKLNEVMQRDMLGGVRGMQPAYAMAGGATVVNNYYNQTINSPKALTRREIYRDSKNLLALKG